MTAPDLMTAAQVAEFLGYTRRHVVRMADSGDLHYVQKLPGATGSYLFARTEINRAARRRVAELTAELERLTGALEAQGKELTTSP